MYESREPNFKKAKEIAPALAGIIVDWSIGAREITATLVDLIVKKNLIVAGEIVYVSNKLFDRKFEESFVKELFDVNKELNFKEISSLAYHIKSEKLTKIIARGLIDEGIIRKDFQMILADSIKDSIKKISPHAKVTIPQDSKQFHIKPRTLKILGLVYIFFQLIVILDLVSVFLFKDSLISVFSTVLLIPLVIIDVLLAIPALLIFLLYRFTKSLTPKYEIILTENGKHVQKEMRILKEFIETHPLYEDRLANVLVGHAIAFGVGKSWMKKLGTKNASMLKLIESLESESDTTTYLIDFDSYIKEFSY
ncbi:MAG: hypothetical protein AABX73_00660 [Nanoarchaeota archaeon]